MLNIAAEKHFHFHAILSVYLTMHIKDFVHPPCALFWLPFALSLLMVLVYLSTAKYDPRESPVIPQPIPCIRHLVGLIRHGTEYYAHIR